MPKENNKMQVDIDTLKKQNVNDLLSIKEIYSKLEELGEKITKIKYIDNTLVKKIKKEYENLNKIILDENIQVQLDNKIDEFNLKLTHDIESINTQLTNDIDTINSQLTNDIETINTQLDTKVNYLTPKMYKDISIEDDSDSIIEVVNQSNNGQKIIFSGNYIINKTIVLNKDVTLDFTGAKVSSNTSSNMFNIVSGDVKIIGLNVDLKNSISKTIFNIENTESTNITNCSFMNFKEYNSDIQQVIVKIKSGSNVVLDNIKFENIVNTGNGVIADHSGASRLILTHGEQNEKRYNIIINNIYVNNIKTINSDGTVIKEDTDSIVTQHSDLLANINISNVVANNFGKRIIKLQGGNVNVNNIQGSNTTGLSSDSFIYVNNSNINISNVRYYSNCDDKGITISDCNNCNINNVIIENMNSNVANNSDLGATILCINSSNINISNLTSTGFSRCVTLYHCFNVNIRDSKITSKHKLATFVCRTLSDYKAPNCKIKDIMITNCKFIVTESYSKPYIEIKGEDVTSELDNIIIENSLIDFKGKGYQYGYILCNSVKNFIMKNNHIKYNTDIENTTILSMQGTTITEIYKTKISSSNGFNILKDILLTGSSKGYIEKSNINKILISTDATAEIDRTDCDISLTGGATTENYKIYSHYEKQ